MKNLIKILAVMSAMAVAASATPISGYINLTAFGSADVDTSANTISFNAPAAYAPYNAYVSDAGGDYAGYLFNLMIYSDFVYDPFVGPQTIWDNLGSASFVLSNIIVDFESSNRVSLSGTGTAYLSGYDPTPGVWSFSADSTTGVNFSWSSTTSVPDGASTVVLIGLGLLAIGFAARGKRRAA